MVFPWKCCDTYRDLSGLSELEIVGQWSTGILLTLDQYLGVIIQKRYTILLLSHDNRSISQIPQSIKQISHKAPFCHRNVYTCAHFCYKKVHCGIYEICQLIDFLTLVLGMCIWNLKLKFRSQPKSCPTHGQTDRKTRRIQANLLGRGIIMSVNMY